MYAGTVESVESVMLIYLYTNDHPVNHSINIGVIKDNFQIFLSLMQKYISIN